MIDGKVIAPPGSDFGGYSVSIVSSPGFTVPEIAMLVGEDGRFRIAVPPTDVTLRVTAPDHGLNRDVTIEVSDETEPEPVEVRLA